MLLAVSVGTLHAGEFGSVGWLSRTCWVSEAVSEGPASGWSSAPSGLRNDHGWGVPGIMSFLLRSLRTERDEVSPDNRTGDIEGPLGRGGIDPDPMDLDLFLSWCQVALNLDHPPKPDTNIRLDLRLDDLELFSFVVHFNELVAGSASVTSDVFQRLHSVRDLYLYYLTIGSMPHG